jgi:hypothetical protein
MRTPLVSEEEVVAFFKKDCVVTWEQLTSYFGITRQQLEQITSVKCWGILLKLLKEGKITHRLEIVCRVKSGKSKALVARELDRSPDTV